MPKSPNEKIYKTYKHGGNLKEFDIDQVFNALKYKLQVVLVVDSNNKQRIYNFVPENSRFYRIY